MQRRTFMVLVGAAVVLWPLAGEAQQRPMRVIGWLHSLSADRSGPVMEAFRDGFSAAPLFRSTAWQLRAANVR
jgi:hypothetical protein